MVSFVVGADKVYLIMKCMDKRIAAMKVLIKSIERAMTDLTDIERQYVEYRYFNGWTVTKCALEIGYSDKSLFNIRKQVLDKFLISLGGLVHVNLKQQK